jgi:hypothetical protein
LVCLDEGSKQLTREVRAPLPATPGRPVCEDYEYERNGVAAILCAVAPHLGWRHLEAKEQRTRREYAHFLRALADEHFAQAECIVLVQDNRNTHRPASLYETFPPAEAARLKTRFEFHFTPKRWSWETSVNPWFRRRNPEMRRAFTLLEMIIALMVSR